MAESKWIPLVPVPHGAGERFAAHIARGKPSAVYDFHNETGLVGHLYRFEGSDGGDRDLPLTYCIHEDTGAMEWRWMSFPQPRPLYGHFKLPWVRNVGQPVLLVDDPAVVEAFNLKATDVPFRVAAFIGGERGLKKVDWSPLDGLDVLLWPTVDEDPKLPRLSTMKQLSAILAKRGCSVKLVDTGDKPPGWNLAALLEEDWNPGDLMAWVTAQSSLVFSRKVFAQDPKGKPIPQPARAELDSTWREKMRLVLRRGEIAECRENVIEFLTHCPDWHGVLAWDEFAYRIVKRKSPPWVGGSEGEWTESDFIELGRWLAHEQDMLVRGHEVLVRAVQYVAERSPYHPVRELIKSVSWDGTERLDFWLADFLGAEQSEYTALVGRFFFINLVRRVFEPGCIMRSVMVLIGRQNQGKSTAMSVIGGEWFADTMFVVGDKDSYQALRGKLLYEIAEFHSFGKAEATKVKAFVSSPRDTFRASYGMSTKDWPRQVSFVATTNQVEIFRDPTGNTRFHPVITKEINLTGLREARSQLLAEAYSRYLAGERAYPTAEQEAEVFKPAAERHEVADPWEHDIREYIRTRAKERVTLNEILYDCLGIERNKLTPAHAQSIQVVGILQKLGCERCRDGGGAREWYYSVPETVRGQMSLAGASGNRDRAEGADDEPF